MKRILIILDIYIFQKPRFMIRISKVLALFSVLIKKIENGVWIRREFHNKEVIFSRRSFQCKNVTVRYYRHFFFFLLNFCTKDSPRGVECKIFIVQWCILLTT